jgi:hypothetical protein
MRFVVQKDARVEGEAVRVWLRATWPAAKWGPRESAYRFRTRSDAVLAASAVEQADEIAALSIVQEE